VFPSSQRGQLRTVKKSAAQAKLSDILATKPISSVNVNQYIPQEKIVYMAQKKQNLHEIIQKMQKEKITIENQDNPNKTIDLASAEGAPAQGSGESADGIYATTGLPPSQDADGKSTTSNSFPNPVKNFRGFSNNASDT
jgi:hypothetical protein